MESDEVVAGTDLVGGSVVVVEGDGRVDVVVVPGYMVVVVVGDMVVVVVMDEVGIEGAVRIQCSEHEQKLNKTQKLIFTAYLKWLEC